MRIQTLAFIILVLLSGTASAKWNEGVGEHREALKLKPNLADGEKTYKICASCHLPEAWGKSDGSIPQLAGQHSSVLLKQLADIRAGYRDNIAMFPFAIAATMGGVQAMSNVVAYIGELKMTADNAKGPGTDLERGKELFDENCSDCHGERGEGDVEEFYPRIQGQHYPYLVRQFKDIRDGRRKNANDVMVDLIQEFKDEGIHAVMDYVSRINPPAELVAPPGWTNPHFEKKEAPQPGH